MANLFERLTYKGPDRDTREEPAIDLQQFRGALGLYNAGTEDAQFIKDTFNMTAEQAAGLDELLGTRPATAADWPGWVDQVYGVLQAGYALGGDGWVGYNSGADIRGKLGLV